MPSGDRHPQPEGDDSPSKPVRLGERLLRPFFAREPVDVARDLLGCVLVADSADGSVGVRLTEVEAYAGPLDPASHAYRGLTKRTAVMFGPAGHLYVYLVYGMHWCANLVTGENGFPSAVLMRAGEVVSGLDLAGRRRATARTPAALARGPAGLATTLGLTRSANDADLCQPTSWLRLYQGTAPTRIEAGPRVGVAAAADVPWRFWVTGDPTVSNYRPAARRIRTTPG